MKKKRNMQPRRYPTRPLVQVAPNYLSGGIVLQEIQNAQDLFTYTYTARKSGKLVEGPINKPSVLIQDLLASFSGSIYPTNITNYTQKQESVSQFLAAQLRDVMNVQTLHPFVPVDKIGQRELFMQFGKNIRNGGKDALNALASVADVETVVGETQSFIYHAAFEHIHSGSTVGKFKANNIQSFYIGTYNQAEKDYLKELGALVANSNIDQMNESQKVTYEYISRLGASLSDETDLITKKAEDIILTDAPASDFMNLKNYERGVKALNLLGEKQEKNAINGINEGISQLIDNIAEILANQNSLMTGWNAPYDTEQMISLLGSDPRYIAELKRRVENLGGPKNINIQALTHKTYDTLSDLVYNSSAEARDQFLSSIYGSRMREFTDNKHGYKMENIAKALGLGGTHHDALVDIRQEREFMFNMGDKFFQPLYDDIKKRTINRNVMFPLPDSNIHFNGLLLQGKTSGSMENIFKYNKDVFAVIRGSNGNVYTSAGFNISGVSGEIQALDKYTPGAWSEGVTYETTNMSIISKDSDMAKSLSSYSTSFVDEDLVKIDYKLAYQDKLSALSEAGLEQRSIYLPKSQFQNLGKYFNLTGYIDEATGKYRYTDFGLEVASAYGSLNSKVVNSEAQAHRIFRDINNLKELDRPERSFTKYAYSTNRNAVMLQEILDEGTFKSGLKKDKAVELQSAIQKGASSDLAVRAQGQSELSAILGSTKKKFDVHDVIDRFMYEDKATHKKFFSNSWLTNCITIGRNIQEGSLWKQMHAATLDIMYKGNFAQLLDSNGKPNKHFNTVYHNTMSILMEELELRRPYRSNSGLYETKIKRVNEANKFFINIEDFVRKYRPDTYIKSKTEELHGNWINIGLDDGPGTISKIIRASEVNIKNDEQERKIVNDFVHFLSTQKNALDEDSRKQLEYLYKTGSQNKDTVDIALEMQSILKSAKTKSNGLYGGYIPASIHMLHNSRIVNGLPEDKLTQESINNIKNIVQKQVDNITPKSDEINKTIGKVKEFILKGVGDEKEFIQKINPLNENLRQAALKVYKSHIDGAEAFAKNFVNGLQGSGISLQISDHNLIASSGGKRINLTNLIPKLQSNTIGTMYFTMNPKSKNIAGTYLDFMDSPDLARGFILKSVLEDSANETFGYNGSFLFSNLRRAIENGDNPAIVLERMMRDAGKPIREFALASGSPATDMINMTKAKLSHLLTPRNIQAISDYYKFNPTNDPDHIEALKVLENYAKNPTIEGLHEDEALLKLMSGDNPLLNPKIIAQSDKEIELVLQGHAKQSSTEGASVAFAEPFGFFDRYQSYERGIQDAQKNAIYLNKNLTEEQLARLKYKSADNINKEIQFKFGQTFATPTEKLLNTYTTETGIQYAGSIQQYVLEADDRIKEEIIKMLRQKSKDDDTLARVFSIQFKPFEGGGWMNGRLYDTFENPRTWQIIKPGSKEIITSSKMNANQYEKGMNLRFGKNEKGEFDFLGYGKGIYVKQNDPIAGFYEQFFGEEKEVLAKRNSIASVMYLSEDGKHVVDEKTLRKVITEKLAKNKLEMNAANFMAMADQTYTKAIVAKRLFDSGIFKVADSDKHESVAGIRTIGDYFSGPITSESLPWQKEESLLSRVFGSQEFTDWSSDILGEDFRKGHAFTAEIYDDITSMQFSSPIFRQHRHKLINAVKREYALDMFGIDITSQKLTEEQEKKLRETFKRTATEARYRTSDYITGELGATFLRMSYGDAKANPLGTVVGHENMDELIESAFNYVSNQLHPGEPSKDIMKDKEKFVEIFNSLGVLGLDGKKFELTLDESGTIIGDANRWNINDITLKQVFGFNGKEIDKNIPLEELKRRQTLAISAFNQNLQWTTTSFLSDTYGSLLGHKITDRELMSYTNTLWDENLVNRLIKNVGDEKKFVSIFGRLIDDGIKSKEDFTKLTGRPVFDRELDFFFDKFAFSRWDQDNPLKLDSKLFKPLTNEADINQLKTYREVKTNELVDKLANGRNVTESYADDLYEVASLRKADAFNISKGKKFTELDLITDNGKISREEINNRFGGQGFFRKVNIGDVKVGYEVDPMDLRNHPYSAYKNNLLINLENQELGLNNRTLSRMSIASAGIQLTPEGQDSITSAEYQKTLRRIQAKYFDIEQLHEQGVSHSSEEYQKAIRDLNTAAEAFVKQQSNYSKGMEKSSKALRVQSTRMPASVTGKVNVFTQNDKLLNNKIINSPNVAIISEGNLANMGFNDAYFKRLAKASNISFEEAKEQWMQKARTEGVRGFVHRNPSDYWGSTMAVQIFVDPTQEENQIAYDSITAAFLKADSDGDYAKAIMRGTVDSKGKFWDINALEMMEKNGTISNDLLRDLNTLRKTHDLRINIQKYDTNAMVKKVADYNVALKNVYEKYVNNIWEGQNKDVVGEFIKNNAFFSLSGKEFNPRSTELATIETKRAVNKNFIKYKQEIVDALNKTNGIDKKFIDNISQSSNGIRMASEIQSYFWNSDLNTEEAKNQSKKMLTEFYNNLGSSKEAIDKAYQEAASVNKGRTLMLNRLARKGVGLSDTQYIAIDLLRANAVNSGRQVLSNEQNAAMFLLKELEKEQVLTPKKQTGAITENVTKNLDELNNLLNDVFKNGENNAALKEKFIDFIDKTARKPDSRYSAESLLQYFRTSSGEIDSRAVWGAAYEGIVNSIKDAKENSPLLRNTILDVTHLATIAKGRRSDIFQHSKTYASYVNNAIASSNGFEDATEMMAQRAAALKAEAASNKAAFQAASQQRALIRKTINSNVVKGFKSTKSLAITALGIAGAAVFGGYAGGNPSVPAQQQAQGIQEQNPPPRTINLADKSLTTASRKQAGYIININAQTQKDKDYASRLITQAVTQNFQDTNVNISMNVNQQPGNISGNDLMDYLEQAL